MLEIMEDKKLPKEEAQKILKSIYQYVMTAIGIMLYFVVLNLAYTNMKLDRLVGDIEVFSGVFLIVGIYLLEKAYKKDSGKLAITAIEFFVLSIHSLTIMHVITMLKYDFRLYLLTSSYVFAIYYIFKSIFVYTKGRMEYVKSFSDIPEIVKKEEPKKKEAMKRKKIEEVPEKKIDKPEKNMEDDKKIKQEKSKKKESKKKQTDNEKMKKTSSKSKKKQSDAEKTKETSPKNPKKPNSSANKKVESKKKNKKEEK